jgi:large subunit ribosomal protein L15
MVSRTKKLRGSRTHGRGKKHGRGHGDRGGRGNAGLHKHKFKWMIKYDPDHFGAYGFVRHAATRKAKLFVNVGDLEDRLPEFSLKGAVHRKDEGYKVDLTMIGIDKLLGAGRANLPLEVIVAEATESAKVKVEAAGGKVITTVQKVEKGE